MSIRTQLMVIERDRLMHDIADLIKFKATPKYEGLDGYDKMLIEFQLPHMHQHLHVLIRRIERL